MKKENKNTFEAISKVVVSSGLGRIRQTNAQFDEKSLPDIMAEFADIVGQKPAVRKAKKSIAGFKVRQNDVVGIAATLRGRRKEDFLTKLTSVVLPRLRDFRGIPSSRLDGKGNLSIGFKDQSVFPEINPEQSKWNFGLEITMVVDKNKIKNIVKGGEDSTIDFYRQIGIPLTVNK
ncbi:MAG: 50S ribosomal protein L5 [Candidatus Colwellbacteria bacterium]|nr:50S ribosomal protein L5 [Candidatus Colwellbacteria bacterium]